VRVTADLVVIYFYIFIVIFVFFVFFIFFLFLLLASLLLPIQLLLRMLLLQVQQIIMGSLLRCCEGAKVLARAGRGPALGTKPPT
jgi:hypothetical protein